jgi:DNA repair exonuclease SbcCD ATPase subunit
MKIIALESENVKYLKAIDIKPDGSLVVIGGDNEAGKTCVLDSIEYGLNGASAIPPEPIRKGQKKAKIVLDLGDIQVLRTFTKKGTNLTVRNKDGTVYASPQTVLNELKGELTFDPLEFSRMDANKQAEVLKKLVGLDFNKINIQYKKLFDQRTIVNRRGKELKANVDAMEHHEGVPDQEVSVKELGVKYAEILEQNQQIARDRDIVTTELSELQQLRKRVAVLEKSVKQKRKVLEGVVVIDAKAIHSQMADAESVNLKVRENKVYVVAVQELAELRKQSGSLSTQMTQITDQKTKDLAKAKFPIKGLAIDEEGVTFEGIPFCQCSTSQRIKVSVAIGLKMNPKLRILLIREGSLLDEKNLAMVAKMAEKADAQIWLERVSKGSECSVIIEDGQISNK